MSSGESRGELDRGGRLARFFARSFPPWVLGPATFASFLAIYLACEALAREGRLEITARAIPGALTVTLFSLLLRVHDELKDVETDLRLGRAGDPRYVDRPIVTGHLKKEDLERLRGATTGLLFGLNLGIGSSLVFAGFLVVFALIWLSSRWFFWPKIQEQILLAFATHNPLALAVSGYVALVATSDFGISREPGLTALLVGLWFPIAAWETSRKVRAPADETEYQTYSMVLGWKTAALVPAAFVLGSLGCLLALGARLELGQVFAGALALAALGAVVACIRFRLSPTTTTANLQPWAELYALVANVALASALIARRGVALA